MSEEREALLRCNLIRKEIRVLLEREPPPAAHALMPLKKAAPWRVKACLEKDTECFEQYCCFTTAGGSWPFPRELAPE